MDPLRFGDSTRPTPAGWCTGSCAASATTATPSGVPTVGGEPDSTPATSAIRWSTRCASASCPADLQLAKASSTGDQVVLFGPATGGDGIGGASILASEEFDEDGSAKRPNVQVGDPFVGKQFIESCLELYQADLVSGIQDIGAAGISCATSEMAAAGDGGMHVELDRVPLRDSTLAPEEILMSELAGADDGRRRARRRRDVPRHLRQVGRRGQRDRRGHRQRPPRSSTGTARPSSTSTRAPSPTTARSTSARSRARRGRTRSRPTVPRPSPGPRRARSCARPCSAWPPAPNLCDKSWITDQYDRYVRGNTVLSQPSDSGMIRVDESTNLGVALSTDCNGRFADLDPYAGAQLALAESYRNVATGGAVPLAISDCLNFGSPEDPEVMWQFAEACRGLKDACLGASASRSPAATSASTTRPARPRSSRRPSSRCSASSTTSPSARRPAFRSVEGDDPGDTVLLLGASRPELSGSEWAHVVHGHLGGTPAAGRPRSREAPGRAAPRGQWPRRRAAHQRPRPLRRRPRPGVGRGRPSATCAACTVTLRRRPVRRALRRVRRSGAGHRRPRRRRHLHRPCRAARGCRSARSARTGERDVLGVAGLSSTSTSSSSARTWMGHTLRSRCGLTSRAEPNPEPGSVANHDVLRRTLLGLPALRHARDRPDRLWRGRARGPTA